MNFNNTRIHLYYKWDNKALKVRIGPLIKDCANFSNYTVPIVAGHLRFPIQHSPSLIDYSFKHFEPCVFEIEAFIGQS
jgi:hypothetical protein